MRKSKRILYAGVCAFALATMLTTRVSAQTGAVKAKAPMYSYISNWTIPRAHWGEMKTDPAEAEIMQKAMADGTLVGYGTDQNMVHTQDGWTHDDWFSSMSEGGIYSVLKQMYASGSATTSVLESATGHHDMVMMSRYYGWHSGSYEKGIVSVSQYQLKENAPQNAMEVISGEIVAPVMEKLLADGTILEYEIDTLAVHTEAPGKFWIVFVMKNPADMDKVHAAMTASIKASPIEGVFGALTKGSAHRDEVGMGDGMFK